MKKTVILTIALMLAAGLAHAQAITVTIASGQSLSPVVNLATAGITNYGSHSVISEIIPPAALDATSYYVVIETCTTAAGSSCWIPYDANGNMERFVITGGATPTGSIQLDPQITAGKWYIKLLVTNSSNVAVAQAGGARSFILFVRPL